MEHWKLQYLLGEIKALGALFEVKVKCLLPSIISSLAHCITNEGILCYVVYFMISYMMC